MRTYLLLITIMLIVMYLIVNYNKDKNIEREHQKKMNELKYLQKAQDIKTSIQLKLDIMELDSIINESRKRMEYTVSVTTAK